MRILPELPISKFLFKDSRTAIFWLIVRLYVGWQWWEAGYGKVVGPGSDKWVGSHAGAAVQGFLMGALKKSSGAHPDVQSWYASFISNFALHHTVLFSYMVAYGELFVAIGLILGLFTGLAAFFGGVMNVNYLFAGTVSTNPVLLILEIPLILAWRVAGLIGVDRYLLPRLFKKKK